MSNGGIASGAADGGVLGLILVHGIGAQEPGAMRRNFAAGLGRVASAVHGDGASGAELVVGGRTVRLYEVYWADLLLGEKTRHTFLVEELVALSWFPWFNLRRRSFANGYTPMRLLPSLALLPIAGLLFFVAYWGARLLAIPWDVSGRRTPFALRHRARSHQGRAPASGVGFWKGSLQKAREGRNLYSVVDRVLDEYGGDILTYVGSATGSFYREANEPPPTEEMQEAQRNIMARFEAVAAEARADGCVQLQIVAHSLGSVIAYHFLAGHDLLPRRHDDRPPRTLLEVQRLYTIGSPLEKFNLFWPGLISRPSGIRARPLTWDNFVSFFDPVASAIRRVEPWGGAVTNHRLLGGGFLRAHVLYQHSPVFLRALSQGICGRPLPIKGKPGEKVLDMLLLAGETLLTPAILVLVLVAGGAFLTVVALGLPYIVSLLVRGWLDPAYWMSAYEWAGLLFAGAFALVFSVTPYLRAAKAHRALWPARGVEPESGA